MIFRFSYGNLTANSMLTDERIGQRKKTKRPSASHKTKSLRTRTVPKPSHHGGLTIRAKKLRPLVAFAKPSSNKL